MSRLTFRNSQGQLVDITSVAATQAKNEFGNLLDEAARGGAVAITRHERPRAVLISYAEFEALLQARSRTLGELTEEFDALLAAMQAPAARDGVARAFAAPPAELGRAAVAAAGRKADRPAVSAGKSAGKATGKVTVRAVSKLPARSPGKAAAKAAAKPVRATGSPSASAAARRRTRRSAGG